MVQHLVSVRACRHQCVECGVRLSSARLLDIHLEELHDSFFAARVARGERLYVCLVDGCTQRFQRVMDRDAHVSAVHKYADVDVLFLTHMVVQV